MKKYKVLLFDVDDTLMDFRAIEAEALKTLFETMGYPLTGELLRAYREVNGALWAAYERGEIAMDAMLAQRFGQTMARFGADVDSAAWERRYRTLLGEGSHVIDGAREVCARLSESHRLFAITNGVGETQRRRLTAAGLYGLFEKVFVSQTIGYQKPAKEFFDYVAANIDGFDRRDALVIGDSLSTDIRGGNDAGIDTCWLNADRQHSAATRTYTIARLTELYGILGIADEG